MAKDAPFRIKTDGTGWVTVTASAESWRTLKDLNDFPEILEQIAEYGEDHLDASLCLAVGAVTKRPCRYRREECPHHGEHSSQNRCGAVGKNGRPCRWNVAARGTCPNHGPNQEQQEGTERIAA